MTVLTIKLFGGAISRDGGSIEDLSMEIDDNIVELINHLPRLSDPQNEFLLLRSCMDIVKKCVVRTYQSIHKEETTI